MEFVGIAGVLMQSSKYKIYIFKYDQANINATHLSSQEPPDSPCPRLSRWSTKTDPWLSFEAPAAKKCHILC